MLAALDPLPLVVHLLPAPLEGVYNRHHRQDQGRRQQALHLCRQDSLALCRVHPCLAAYPLQVDWPHKAQRPLAHPGQDSEEQEHHLNSNSSSSPRPLLP